MSLKEEPQIKTKSEHTKPVANSQSPEKDVILCRGTDMESDMPETV